MVERIAYMGKYAADAANLSSEDYLKLVNSRKEEA